MTTYEIRIDMAHPDGRTANDMIHTADTYDEAGGWLTDPNGFAAWLTENGMGPRSTVGWTATLVERHSDGSVEVLDGFDSEHFEVLR